MVTQTIWVYNASPGSGVKWICVCFVVLYPLYALSWLRSETLSHSLWETSSSRKLLHHLYNCVCVKHVFVQVRLTAWGCAFACVWPSPYLCVIHKYVILQWKYQFSELLRIGNKPANLEKSWICCEGDREKGLFYKNKLMQVSVWNSTFDVLHYTWGSQLMCAYWHSSSIPFFLPHIHMHTHSCCSGLWTDVLWDSREFPSWVNKFLCHYVGCSCGQGSARREVEKENIKANFSLSEWTQSLKNLTKVRLRLYKCNPVFSLLVFFVHKSQWVCK